MVDMNAVALCAVCINSGIYSCISYFIQKKFDINAFVMHAMHSSHGDRVAHVHI